MGSSPESLLRTLNPIYEGTTLMDLLLKVPSPSTITLEVRFQHINFEGTQSVYCSWLICLKSQSVGSLSFFSFLSLATHC